ncbi:hypothetical protein Vretimale_8281, partial [Volvox reticuliferus]
ATSVPVACPVGLSMYGHRWSREGAATTAMRGLPWRRCLVARCIQEVDDGNACGKIRATGGSLRGLTAGSCFEDRKGCVDGKGGVSGGDGFKSMRVQDVRSA